MMSNIQSVAARFSKFRLSQDASTSIYVLSALGTSTAILAKVVTGMGLPAVAGYSVLVAGMVAFLVLFPLVSRLLLGWRRIAAPVFVLLCVAVILVAAPRLAAMHAVGRGSDQGACIAVAAQRMASGLWPYSSDAMWTHNAMSCGPLWAALHLPLLDVLTYPLAMLALVALSMAIVVFAVGAGAAATYATLLALVPGYWLALANGNDFATLGLVLVAMIALSTSAHTDKGFVRGVVVVGVMCVSQARLPFLLLPAIVFMDAKRWPGWLGPVAQGVTLAVWMAFLLFNPSSFTTEGPMHVLGKAHALIAPELFVGALAVGAVGLFALGRSVALPDVGLRTELYISVVLVGMSGLDLVEKIHARQSIVEAFTYWEGASWLTGVACLTAFGVAMRSARALAPFDGRVITRLRSRGEKWLGIAPQR